MSIVMQFPAPPSLPLAHPAGVPLVPDPVLVDAAAYALASLAGEDWSQMTAHRLEEYRTWATFAATCAQPSGLRLVGYSTGLVAEFQFIDAPPTVRRGMAERLMDAIYGTAKRVRGVANPRSTEKLVALIAQDDATTGWTPRS